MAVQSETKLERGTSWLLPLRVGLLDSADRFPDRAQRTCSDLAHTASVGANFDLSTEISVG